MGCNACENRKMMKAQDPEGWRDMEMGAVECEKHRGEVMPTDDVPEAEDLIPALDVLESRLARQGQYDQAVDVGSAIKRMRLDSDEITRLRALVEKRERQIVWCVDREAYRHSGNRFVWLIDGAPYAMGLDYDGTDAGLLAAIDEVTAEKGEKG